MIGLATTNALPTMAPWGGADALVGLNPLTAALPAAQEPPLVLDISFGAAARGKIVVYGQKGLPLPEGWACDAQGRPTTDPARALPAAQQPLHGRLKRLGRWSDNPHLDELALSVRWLRLTYAWVAPLPEQPREQPLLPILLDTVYFQPFAVLLASVPCGSRGLPIALTTYHRQTLEACFPPEATWPDASAPTAPTLRQRRGSPGGSPSRPRSA